jgi:hypothetical protein
MEVRTSTAILSSLGQGLQQQTKEKQRKKHEEAEFLVTISKMH